MHRPCCFVGKYWGPTLPVGLMATIGNSATVRWLQATALSAVTTGQGDQHPHKTRFGTTRGSLSTFLLRRSWRYRLTELNLHLHNQTDMLTMPLPEPLRFLYPLLRLPLWVLRHAAKRPAGHECLSHLVQGTVCKILGQEDIKPYKVRYYLERRDAEFEQKMAEVLCVYREVQVLKKATAKPNKPETPVAIVSYDEKPGIQAIATTAPDLPPVPGVHATFARDHEYKRYGTLSLLAGIDLLTGKVHALVRDRHRSKEFIEFLKLLDAAYPASTRSS